MTAVEPGGELKFEDLKPGDIFLVVYPAQGVPPRFERIRTKRTIVQESEIPVIRDVLRSVCLECKVNFELASPDEMEVVFEKSYGYLLYPCRIHIFKVAEIQRMIDSALRLNLELTKEMRMGYDPTTAWDYTAPL